MSLMYNRGDIVMVPVPAALVVYGRRNEASQETTHIPEKQHCKNKPHLLPTGNESQRM